MGVFGIICLEIFYVNRKYNLDGLWQTWVNSIASCLAIFKTVLTMAIKLNIQHMFPFFEISELNQ